MRPSVGLVSTEGVLPVSTDYDTVGPMAKCVRDIADTLDVLVDRHNANVPGGSYSHFMTRDWTDISVGTLDPSLWKFNPDITKPVHSATIQMINETSEAYKKLEKLAKKVCNVPLIHGAELDKIDNAGDELLLEVGGYDEALKGYLQTLEKPKVSGVAELVDFNQAHADVELPKGYDKQDMLIAARDAGMTKKRYQELRHQISVSLANAGVDPILKHFGVDVIIGPSDSDIYTVFGLSGYPAVTLPLGYLEFNGRPFGLVALASRHQEPLLIKVASAWEATFPKRQPPRALEEHRKGHSGSL
ncbi:amidase family protein [Cladophialophora carrionii]|uniref:Amidase family protein n=1 Tax=Cladophialophora carrionii TaxID=86049 RepID=A0A1C1CCS9_9EURO|nr:amidase family protein [Cladophialophora carrionii]